MEYVVRPLKEEKNSLKWDHPLLPKPPFRICTIAASSSGKSVLTAYMFGSDEMPYKAYFKSNIFIFSPTAKIGSMDIPGIKKENIFDTFDIETVSSIMKEQEDLIHRYKRKIPLLYVLDDVVSDMNQQKKDALKKLFFHGRHLAISMVVLSQQYRAIPKSVRTNASHMILMNLSNQGERKSVSEEQPFHEQKFLRIVDHALEDQQYSFLVICYANPKGKKLQLRLSSTYYSI